MKARQVFTALMASKGYTSDDLSMDGDKYTNPAMQGRWNYFIAGWEMRGQVPLKFLEHSKCSKVGLQGLNLL